MQNRKFKTTGRTLVTFAAATALTVGGTGIASAQDDDASADDATAAEAPADDAGEDDGDSEDASGSLGDLAKPAKDIKAIAGAFSAVISASDSFQGVIDDTLGFLENAS